MEEGKQRLAKRIAESGIASRRDAERLIAEGRVAVDGQVVNTPVCFVTSENIVTVDGKPIAKKSEKIVIWKFYKPVGVITSKRDHKGRKTVFDYFADKFALEKSCISDERHSGNRRASDGRDLVNRILDDRLLYVGRLDCNSEGLLLFVNNGDLARKMELPATAIPRTYKARIYGKLPKDAKEKLLKGVTIDGVKYGSVIIEEDNSSKISQTSFTEKEQGRGIKKSQIKKVLESKNRWVTITLREGKNREVRKLMRYFGCEVNRLIRVSYGPFDLGKLCPGEIEKVRESQVHEFVKEYL